MLKEIVLTNDKQRKEFLDDFTNEEIGWSLLKYDSELRFYYWQAKFSDGSRIVVLYSRDGVYVPIKTLVKKGENYFPRPATQTLMLEHLREVANK